MTERIYQESFVVGGESIDVLGHVNNREYLRWMERIATNHAASLGWDLAHLRSIGHVWVAREHWIEYLRPCFLSEPLTMYSWVQSFRAAASLRRYAVKRGGELIMVGATEWVFVDFDKKRPALFTPDVKAAFEPILVPADDPALLALGIARAPRPNPSHGL